MKTRKRYDQKFKIQAVGLALKVGPAKAASELALSDNTIYSWMKTHRDGRIDLGPGTQTHKKSSMNEKLIKLRKKLKEQAKEIKRLKEENDFLEEASTFFAACRRKSAKT